MKIGSNKSIDIIIAVAEKGGVENVISVVSDHLVIKGWQVRVIQFVWEGVEWLKSDASFFALLYGRQNHTIQEFIDKYTDFLKTNGVPRVIISAGWPYLCYVAKQCTYNVGAKNIVISWLHAPLERYEAAGYGGIEALECADVHFTISDYIKNEILENGGVKPINRICNPVDFSDEIEVSIEELQGSAELHKLVFVGRLSEEKGIDTIIRAIANCMNIWELHLIGTASSEYQEYLEYLIEKYKVANVVYFYGWQKNPWKIAANCDMAVLASIYEGFPLTAIEAAANGLPVVSTPVSGISELIEPGVNGFLFPVGDAEMLSHILMAYAKGAFGEIDPQICRDRVRKYDKEIAINDFEMKLLEYLD